MEEDIVELAQQKRDEKLKDWKIERICELLGRRENLKKGIEEVGALIKKIEDTESIPSEGSIY